MADLERRAQVLSALPEDGSYAAYAYVAETVGGDGLYETLRELRDEGLAVLTHGRGWRRAGPEPRSTHTDPRADYMATVAETVARAGHMVQYVGGDDAGTVAPFAYTVGCLTRLGFELVVTGALDPATLQGLLNCAAALDPFPAARGVPQAGVMAPPYTAVLLDTRSPRCKEEGHPLNIARAWWTPLAGDLPAGCRPDDFPVVQVCWPDSGYRYPWSRHFDYRGKLGGQPLLADPPAGSAP